MFKPLYRNSDSPCPESRAAVSRAKLCPRDIHQCQRSVTIRVEIRTTEPIPDPPPLSPGNVLADSIDNSISEDSLASLIPDARRLCGAEPGQHHSAADRHSLPGSNQRLGERGGAAQGWGHPIHQERWERRDGRTEDMQQRGMANGNISNLHIPSLNSYIKPWPLTLTRIFQAMRTSWCTGSLMALTPPTDEKVQAHGTCETLRLLSESTDIHTVFDSD